ncbi:18747_t:CDS:2, partial [Funneliformis geosporum]
LQTSFDILLFFKNKTAKASTCGKIIKSFDDFQLRLEIEFSSDPSKAVN